MSNGYLHKHYSNALHELFEAIIRNIDIKPTDTELIKAVNLANEVLNFNISELSEMTPEQLNEVTKKIIDADKDKEFIKQAEENLNKFIDKHKKLINKKTLKVKYFDKEIPKLEKISIGDWIDLRASETVELKQFEFKLIPLGIGMILPEGYEANIVPRSSTFKNFGILQTNSFGVIDNSYSGDEDEWKFPALAMRDTVIKKGDRICQFRINKRMNEVEIIEVKKLNEKSRGGFGSTGKN